MDLHTQLSKNMEEIVTLFESRMGQFDMALSQSQSQTSKSSIGNVESLIADYTIFKELMWKSLSILRQQLQLLSSGFDNHEMLSRRKALLLHGLPEDKGDIYQQVHATLCNQMKLCDLDNNCVDICHRLGVKGNKTRPVLVRFSTMKFKNIVWNAKTALKGTGITVSEFLTKPRQEVFLSARKHFLMKNCWTSDGAIIIALPDKTRKKVITSLELQLVIRTYPQTDEVSQDFKSTRSRRVNKNSEIDDETIAVKIELLEGPRRQFREANRDLQDKITENIRIALQSSTKVKTATKIHLMRIKQKAIGTKSIPASNRVYFAVKKPTNPDPKSINIIKSIDVINNIKNIESALNPDLKDTVPVFISSKWSLGRAIDCICETCNVPNDNNKMSDTKLRLFRKLDGYCISPFKMEIEISELLKNEVLLEGDKLIIEYVNSTELCNLEESSQIFLSGID